MFNFSCLAVLTHLSPIHQRGGQAEKQTTGGRQKFGIKSGKFNGGRAKWGMGVGI